MATDNDMLNAIDDTAQLEGSWLGGDLLVATQVGMGHQVSSIADWGKVWQTRISTKNNYISLKFVIL